MALGAQTAAAAPAVVKYDSKLTITHEAVFPKSANTQEYHPISIGLALPPLVVGISGR
jgi:hypothetical protein